MFERILATRPDWVFLCLGGNYLDRRAATPVIVVLVCIARTSQLWPMVAVSSQMTGLVTVPLACHWSWSCTGCTDLNIQRN